MIEWIKSLFFSQKMADTSVGNIIALVMFLNEQGMSYEYDNTLSYSFIRVNDMMIIEDNSSYIMSIYINGDLFMDNVQVYDACLYIREYMGV